MSHDWNYYYDFEQEQKLVVEIKKYPDSKNAYPKIFVDVVFEYDKILLEFECCKGIGDFDLRLAAKNIYDCRYEVVSGYPMPGRSVIGGVYFKF